METVSPADLPIFGDFSERALSAEEIDILLLRRVRFKRMETGKFRFRGDGLYFDFRND